MQAIDINTVEFIYVMRDGSSEKDCYKVIQTDGTVSSVPFDTANKDYDAVQEWIADGNTVTDSGGE